MRNIYIVLTQTNSILARMIKRYTHKEYSHVSIALDENLQEMFSFGRLNPYNPFVGGFVRESPDFGTFKRFYKTRTKILALSVSEEQYNRIKRNIMRISLDKGSYRFNIIGMFAVALRIRIRRNKYFYCAEFVKHILESSDVDIKLPELIKPEDFDDIKGSVEIYSGVLRDYKTQRLNLGKKRTLQFK